MVAVHGFTDLLDSPTNVVTAAVGDDRSGCLVSRLTVFAEPGAFRRWLSKANRTDGAARRAPFLGVHLLRRDQCEPARLFGAESGDRVDKFARTRWEPGAGGAPVLSDACARFVGRVERQADWGDHVGFHLTPVEGDAEALPRGSVLSLSDVTGLTPGHPA